MLKQKTLKDSFSLSGKGLHTGLDLTVTFNPAPDNHGYKIQRIDVEGPTNYRCSSRQCDGNNPWHSIVKEWSQSKYRRAWYGSPLCIGH